MNKYEKMLKDNVNKAEKVLAVLKVLDGETTDDAKDILDAAKFFMLGASTFNNDEAADWIKSLGGDYLVD
jgi:hypothetical protein